MLVVKLVEKQGGTFIAEMRNKGSLTFKETTREQVIQFLMNKATEIGEEIRFVEEFRSPTEEHVNWEKIIKKHY